MDELTENVNISGSTEEEDEIDRGEAVVQAVEPVETPNVKEVMRDSGFGRESTVIPLYHATKNALDGAYDFPSPTDIPKVDAKAVDLSAFPRTPNDTNDPSYTNLTLPYRVICRQRYRKAGAALQAQFKREIRQHELLQGKALDGVRIHREFCNGVITPVQPEEMIKLTAKQKAKIEEILARP